MAVRILRTLRPAAAASSSLRAASRSRVPVVQRLQTRAASAVPEAAPSSTAAVEDGPSAEPLPGAPAAVNGHGNPVDWGSSFHGLSTVPFPRETAEVLMRELRADDVEIKPDGILFLPEIKYRRIMNLAFGPGGWGLAPRGDLDVGDKVVTREYALVVHGRCVPPPLFLTSRPVWDRPEANRSLGQIYRPGPRRVPVLRPRDDSRRRRGLQVQRADAVLQGPGRRLGDVGPRLHTRLQEEAVDLATERLGAGVSLRYCEEDHGNAMMGFPGGLTIEYTLDGTKANRRGRRMARHTRALERGVQSV